MPIRIRLNENNCLRVVCFEGVISPADIEALVAVYDQQREWLGYDSIYLLDAESVDIDARQLDELRRRVFAIYREIDLIIVRRSAWISKNPRMRRLAEYWVSARHSRDGTSAEFCLGDTLDDALPLFSKAELETVRTGTGFSELAQIGAAA